MGRTPPEISPRNKRSASLWRHQVWINRNVERAQDLSLDRGRRRSHSSISGAVPVSFFMSQKNFGHTGVGLDIDEQAIFRDTLRLLKVKRVVHCIQPHFHLPAPEKKFDLITSYLTCFHRLERLRDGNWRTWSAAEWQFFIDDVRAHQIAEGGMLLLEFHPQKNSPLSRRCSRIIPEKPRPHFSLKSLPEITRPVLLLVM